MTNKKKNKSIFTEGDINTSDERKNWLAQINNQQTLDYLEKDARFFLHQALSTPCLDVVASSKGSSLYNLEGKKYLDFHGNSTHQIGFGNEVVIEKLKAQLDECSFSTRRYTNKAAVDLAEKLTSLLPSGMNKVLFAPGGAEVNGIALKLARMVTGKHKVISYWDSFHGATLDTISAGGEAIFRENMGPLMPGVIRIPPPMNFRGFFDDEIKTADYLEYVIEKEGEIGAFIAEPIRNTDVQIPSAKYWQRIREICTRHNILLILDEIPTALGRTGKMFAFENFGIEPDIITLGKGLGGGIVPFAAMVCRDEYDIASTISLGHYTHEKSPLGSAAAHATIDFIQNNNLLNKVMQDEIWMKQKLDELKSRHKMISDVRGIGLLWALELIKNDQPAIKETEKIMYTCLRNGLSFKVSHGNTILLSPALTIDKNELEEAISILDRAIYANQ